MSGVAEEKEVSFRASGSCSPYLFIKPELKNLKNAGNMFILNLAVADLTVTAFVDPFSIVGVVHGGTWFESRPALCEIIASLCLTSCFCSLLSIGAIAFNRFIHICHHDSYDKLFTTKKTILMCFGLWVFSFLAESPNFFGWGDHVYDTKTLSCVWDRVANFSYTVFFSGFGVAFPVVLISICYMKILLHVRASKRKLNDLAAQVAIDARTPKVSGEYLKLARTMFLVFLVFAICWTPYAVLVVADRYDTYPREVHLFSIVVAHTNSSLNSVLYGVTNKNFRNGYRKFLRIDWILVNLRIRQGNVRLHESTGTAVESSFAAAKNTHLDVKGVSSF